MSTEVTPTRCTSSTRSVSITCPARLTGCRWRDLQPRRRRWRVGSGTGNGRLTAQLSGCPCNLPRCPPVTQTVMKGLRILVPSLYLLLTACSVAPGSAASSPRGTSAPSPAASPTATPNLTHIAVTGAVTGDFQNAVSVCNQSYPVPSGQTTAVSATGQLNGKIAQLIILDPTGPPDYETQGYASLQLQMPGNVVHNAPDKLGLSGDPVYGWTQIYAPGTSSHGIVKFNRNTGATFSVDLNANRQAGSSQPDGLGNVTVTGTIYC